MKKLHLLKKITFLFLTLFLVITLYGCSNNMYLSEFIDLNFDNVEQIKIYKKKHQTSILSNDESQFFAVIEITEKDEIESFLNNFNKIIIVDDAHISDRFDYDFDNNLIYIEIDEKTLVFIENEVRYNVYYTIKNIDSIDYIKEYFK